VIYLIRVSGLLHHGTSVREDHEAYAAQLIESGRAVTTEQRESFLHISSHMARIGAKVYALGSPAMAVTIRGDDRLNRSR